MEEVCQWIKNGKVDREAYKEKMIQINNLGRKIWENNTGQLVSYYS
jgi:hypothetical protein